MRPVLRALLIHQRAFKNMEHTNYIDFETYNAVPIKHGTYKYTSTCEPMICTYAFGPRAPAQCWDITTGEPMPYDLRYVLDDPSELWTAHSSMFDRNVLRYALGLDVPIPRWRDTMVKALCHGLPGGLDILCDIFNVDDEIAKNKDGKQLIRLFCVPRPANQKLQRATRETHPREWQTFIDYALGDITAMQEVDRLLPEWNYRDGELALWHLDQRINDRGICIDTRFATEAIRAVKTEAKRLAEATSDATEGVVPSATKRDLLLAYLAASFGIELPDMQKATLERRVNDPNLPLEFRQLLALRLSSASTSTSKYTALLNGVQDDGRLRGTLQFAGAARTRRWAGRTFQPQNLPRPDAKFLEIEFGIDAMLHQAEALVIPDDVEEGVESSGVMRAARNAIRSSLIAPPGKKLCVADLSNIEGVGAAWLANEDWKLQKFRDYYAGTGSDLYVVAYAAAFNVPEDSIDKKTIDGYFKRQIGKVMELMLQYEGGVGAFITGAATYNIDLDELAVAAKPTIPSDAWKEAVGMWEWTLKKGRQTYGLPMDVFCTCDALKRLWRWRHLAIVQLWKDLAENVRAAIRNPGVTFRIEGNDRFIIRVDGRWLRIRLPSGRYLCYPNPRVDDNDTISYMGMNQYTHRWSRITTYGGKLLENATQAFAGDVLKANMPAIEDAGYEIVLTVHDEAVTETPDIESHSGEALAGIMATVPTWAPGLPLNAAGYSTYRYRKED